MATLNTLNTLIDDIMEEIRNNNISESESITRIQIEQWIHQYRALLIKQDLDKGRYTNPNYIQTINLTITSPQTVDTHYKLFSSEIPNTIDLHFKSGITGVMNTMHDEIQLIPYSRSRWHLNKKFSSKEPIAYLHNNRIYIKVYSDTLTSLSIYVNGIFEDPTLVSGFDVDDVYPIPANMVSTLKWMIFKNEFNITLTYPTDTTNDGSNDNKSVNIKQ